MSLYQVPGDSLVSPKRTESYEYIQALQRKLPQQTFDKIVRTIDNAIHNAKPSKSSGLVWVTSASLFGYSSMQPNQHVNHLWHSVVSIVGPDKGCLKAVGGLLRWRIASSEGNTWLVTTDTIGIDPDDGKKITRSEYWIDNSYGRVDQSSVNKLAEAWGARL